MPKPPRAELRVRLLMLVIDAYKGIQTQTAECLVIGELTNDKLIVVLNKLALLPPDSLSTTILTRCDKSATRRSPSSVSAR